MFDRYLGPLIVIKRSKGGSYILAEMDGSVFDKKVAAFRVIPYYARKHIKLPESIHELIDLSPEGLEKLDALEEPLNLEDSEETQVDFAFDGIRLQDTEDMSADERSGDENEATDEEEFETGESNTTRVTRSQKLRK